LLKINVLAPFKMILLSVVVLMKKRNLSILIICLFFFTCKKDSDVFIPHDNPITDITYVMGSVGGVVIDEGANPIANASIKLFTKTDSSQDLMTDENGIFLFRNVEMNAERTYLQIEKEGFFKSARNFTPRTNGTEFLKLQLMSTTSSSSYLAADGGLVDVMGGGSIEFPADAIVGASGDVYNGSVQVISRFINGTSLALGNQMPGNMMALNSEGETKVLASYGIIALDLTTENGATLQIASDKEATVRIPVPDSLLNNYPTTISLWYFDDVMGLWVEEGQGQLVGDFYESTIRQATYWNWAIPHNQVNLKGSISIGNNNVPFGNVYTKLTVVGGGVCALGYTDDGGVVDGAVAANQILRLQVYDNCFNEIYNAEIGPYPSGVSLGEIPVAIPNGNLVELTGALTCDEMAVTNGYVKLVNGESEQFIFTDSEGKFSNAFNLCFSDGFDLIGVDMTNVQQSVSEFYVGEETVEVGTINVCE